MVEWSHQVRDVLNRSSAEPLLQGTHPSPLIELDFWKARRADLESVVDQLCSEKVVKMGRLLEKTLSSYYPAYQSMLNSIYTALDESRDIRFVPLLVGLEKETFVYACSCICSCSMHLKPLRPQLEEMEELEYGELEQRFPPLFHTICLIWRHSKHYQQPGRLVVLLQEISNLLIEMVYTVTTIY